MGAFNFSVVGPAMVAPHYTGTINPLPAAVRPRVHVPDAAEPLLLEDEISRRIEMAQPDLIELTGPTWSGKSMAIAHLPTSLVLCQQDLKSLQRKEQIMPNTVRFHRVLRASPDKVYRAFIDPDAMVKWLPPNGFTGRVHQMDAKVGGEYKMSFTNFTSGHGHSFGGKYLELAPNERLRYTDRFDDPNLPGEMTTTVTLKKVSCGTELNIVQEGLPEVIPPEACCLGWQESLTLLAKLVEAEIPD